MDHWIDPHRRETEERYGRRDALPVGMAMHKMRPDECNSSTDARVKLQSARRSLAKGPELTSAPQGPAQQHAYDAARFTDLVESASAGDWARPSPVAEWTALDIVKHLVEWPRGLLKSAGIDLPALDVQADPIAAWKQHATDIQAILDDPGGRMLRNPNIGDKPVDEAIDQFYTADVWIHSWDLAKALGHEPDLGQERCSAALADMEQIDQLLRDSGQFGPAVPVAHDASPQDKLMAFIGRDPAWQPTGGASQTAS